jgi:hypothetical protein
VTSARHYAYISVKPHLTSQVHPGWLIARNAALEPECSSDVEVSRLSPLGVHEGLFLGTAGFGFALRAPVQWRPRGMTGRSIRARLGRSTRRADAFTDRLPPMYPALLFLPLLYALTLAAIAFVPGVLALALVLATKKSKPQAGNAAGCFHGLFMASAILLLSIASGFVGTGILSVGINLALAIIALISYSVSPTAGGDMDEGAFGFLDFGALSLGFLGFFALGVARLVRWFGPKTA